MDPTFQFSEETLEMFWMLVKNTASWPPSQMCESEYSGRGEGVWIPHSPPGSEEPKLGTTGQNGLLDSFWLQDSQTYRCFPGAKVLCRGRLDLTGGAEGLGRGRSIV